MIIEIPDYDSPKNRRRQMIYEPIIYALKLHKNNIKKAAQWLGFSGRAIRNRMHDHDDLKKLIREKRPHQVCNVNALEKQRNKVIGDFLKSFDCSQMTDKQIRERLEGIRKVFSEGEQ